MIINLDVQYYIIIAQKHIPHVTKIPENKINVIEVYLEKNIFYIFYENRLMVYNRIT